MVPEQIDRNGTVGIQKRVRQPVSERISRQPLQKSGVGVEKQREGINEHEGVEQYRVLAQTVGIHHTSEIDHRAHGNGNRVRADVEYPCGFHFGKAANDAKDDGQREQKKGYYKTQRHKLFELENLCFDGILQESIFRSGKRGKEELRRFAFLATVIP